MRLPTKPRTVNVLYLVKDYQGRRDSSSVSLLIVHAMNNGTLQHQGILTGAAEWSAISDSPFASWDESIG